MFSRFFHFIFDKLFKINDSAQKISLGLGLGVFSGLLPGTGPAAALFLAFIFRANRAAALFGGLATNTWLSIVTFVLAIKVGSVILNKNWQAVQESLRQGFSFSKLFKLSFLEVLLPVLVGYLVIGLCLAALSYGLAYWVLTRSWIKKHLNK